MNTATGSRGTVLVVEDNPVTRKMLRVALAAEGYAVQEAGDAQTALDTMARDPADLVLQDLALPDMDGFELVRWLRALPAAADIPILALSGLLPRMEQARATQAGFTDYVFKPVDPSHLVAVVGAYLPAVEDGARASGGGRHVLVADDDPIQLKLTKLRLREAGYEVATAADGAEALEVAQCEIPDAVVSDVLMPRLDGFRFCVAMRRDPRLARVPVVLTSSAFVEEADRELAAKAGASALVLRTPEHKEVLQALATALREGARLPAAAPELPPEHYADRITVQLERQVRLTAGMAHRLSVRAAEVAILSSAITTLTHGADLSAVLGELLGRCLDAVGVSRGATYLRQPDGSLALAAHIGYGADSADAVARFFGHSGLLAQALEGGSPVAVPRRGVPADDAAALLSAAGVTSLLIVPVMGGSEPLGVFWMASEQRAVPQEWTPFAKGIAGQLANAIALSRAFIRLAAAEEKYRSLFENAVEGIFQLAPDGRMLTANPAMARLLGYRTPEDLLAGVPAIEQVYADRRDGEALRRRLEENGLVSQFQAQALRRDGERIWIRASARAVRDAAGVLRGFDGSAEDLTEHWKSEELRKLEERRRQQLQIKDQFLSHVSHELRTPLSVIHQFVTILLDGLAGPVSPEQRESLDVVLRNVGQLRGMIDDLLEATRADTARLAIEPRPTALDRLIAEAVQALRTTAAAKEIDLSATVAAGLPFAQADPERLTQVLFNLIGNAIKFTPERGRVTVTAAVGPERGMLSVSVADTGTGISPSEKRKIFDYLYQGANVGESGRRGFGIGLYVSKDLVTRQGGEIWVESEVGRGSVFTFTLPVAGAARSAKESAATGKEGA